MHEKYESIIMEEQKITGFLMKTIVNNMESKINTQLKESQITVTQLEFMAYIFERDDVPQVMDFAEHFQVKHPSVLHVLKILEDKEYIYRKKIPQGRGSRIYLTDAGKNIVKENKNLIIETEKKMMNGISDENIRLFSEVLDRMRKNLEEDV